MKRKRNGSSILNRSRNAAAHMTWATGTLGRSVSRTQILLKKNLWVWPIIAVVLLTIIGYGVRDAIETTMKDNLQSGLQTLLDVETAMLETWYEVQSSNAETLANDIEIRQQIYKLLESKKAASEVVEDQTQVVAELEAGLAPVMTSHEYIGYFVANKKEHIVASSAKELVGQSDIAEYDGFIHKALEGSTVVSPPFPSVVMMKTSDGHMRTEMPTMYVCSPIRDVNFQIVAVLALQIRPDKEFTRILQLGQLFTTGETYAFNAEGTMVSNSRFDDELMLMGLLPDRPGSRSILNLQLRDPQGDITEGFRPKVHRADLPFTRMAAAALDGQSGVDVEGYRDYRGVPVVGAWRWLPKYDIGIATEVDVEEAFRSLFILHRVFWVLLTLLLISAIAIFVFTIIVARLRREAQKAALEAKQVGQYQIKRQIGAGGMGIVYEGQHAMLRRPTAVKMLDIDKVNEASIQRFEREVQITCQLNHPNTVAIYDYGRTPEGMFYYAMEYLNGIDLQTLVEAEGPQPEARVIKILLQVCGSLYEAHSLGLVHRDIKPANIMLNRRGAEPDIVKVLDFGLVKAVDEEKQAQLTSAGSITGTPLYMSPEAIESPETVDTRSDLYAVGAVGYFLLTGKPVFDARTVVELCQAHLTQAPIPPSEQIGETISQECEQAIMSCLEKGRANRPQTARDLARLLSRSPALESWTIEQADAWWNQFERRSTTGKPRAESAVQLGKRETPPKPWSTAGDEAVTLDS